MAVRTLMTVNQDRPALKYVSDILGDLFSEALHRLPAGLPFRFWDLMNHNARVELSENLFANYFNLDVQLN